jgi:hypothetical protein
MKTKSNTPPWKLELVEAPRKMAICETTMRYDVVLNGAVVDELYFNMRGYVGYLPLPTGGKLDIGEVSISRFRREVALLNREAREPVLALS